MSNEQEKPESQVEINGPNELSDAVTETDQAEAPVQPDIDPETPSLEELIRERDEARQKAQENWEKVLRMQAEMENLKKRVQMDLENAHKYGLEKFAKELLNVIDSLELGVQACTGDNPDIVKLREGSELTIKQFLAVFEKFNIVPIDPLGEPFNPGQHQAMSMQPSAEYGPNTVMNVFQKGYLLNGRLIRPAMVVVSQAAAESPETGPVPKIDEQA